MKTYYDVHCHVFNKNVIIRRLVSIVQSLLAIDNLIGNNIPEEHIQYKLEEIDKVLTEVTQDTSEDVYQALNNVYKDKVVTTPLMFDLTYADDNDGWINLGYRLRIKIVFEGLTNLIIPLLRRKIRRKYKNPKSAEALKKVQKKVDEFADHFKILGDGEVEIFDDANYKQQLNDLEDLSETYEQIKPFYSIDPRREHKGLINTIEKVKEKILDKKGRFYGIKLYAPAGFSPTDPVLMGTNKNGIYALCQENKIPITVHNSDGGFSCFSTVLDVRGDVLIDDNIVRPKKPLRFKHKFFGPNVQKAIAERARKLNHPRLWELVLEEYPNLVINFAHFGGSGQIMEYINYDIPNKKIDKDDFEDALELLTKEEQEIIKKYFTKKWRKMVLKENLTYDERAQIWNLLYRAGFIDNWTKAIFDIIKNKKYPNTYTDLSCFSEGTLIELPKNKGLTFSIKEDLNTFKHNFFDKLKNHEKSKILYGSDFFLTQFFGPNMKQYFIDFKEAFGNDFDRIAHNNPKRFLNIKP